MSFNLMPYIDEIKNSYWNSWLDEMMECGVKTEEDFLYWIVYTWQQSTAQFNHYDLRKTKDFFTSHMEESEIVCYKGIRDLKEIKPLREFESSTSKIEVAKHFSQLLAHTKHSYIFLIKANKWFKVDEKTRDMGEDEYILYKPELIGVYSLEEINKLNY